MKSAGFVGCGEPFTPTLYREEKEEEAEKREAGVLEMS